MPGDTGMAQPRVIHDHLGPFLRRFRLHLVAGSRGSTRKPTVPIRELALVLTRQLFEVSLGSQTWQTSWCVHCCPWCWLHLHMEPLQHEV